MAEEKKLLEFYGRECQPCVRLRPLIEKLEREEGVRVEKIEVWHNDDNAKLMEEYSQERCLGVPFLYNTKTGKYICGLTDYDTIKEWALE